MHQRQRRRLLAKGGVPATDPIPPAPTSGTIPRMHGPMKIDGEWDEPTGRRRGAYRSCCAAHGNLLRPYMEVRFLHDDKYLYLALFSIGPRHPVRRRVRRHGRVAARAILRPGKLEPPDPEIKVVPEVDGTLDDKHKDEEWKP